MTILERAFAYGIFDFLCFALFSYATGSRWEWAPMFAGIYAASVVAPYRGGRP